MVSIQFIQPARNIGDGKVLPVDISRTFQVPADVQLILQTSCYDCHSNHTRYPWYARMQPGGWWLASHIKAGKAELNFNEFGKYSRRRQQSKLKAMAGSVKEGSMPLPAYTWLHTKAKLNQGERDLIESWALKTRDSL